MKLYVREEYFGSVVYEPIGGKYFNLDHKLTSALLRATSTPSRGPDEVELLQRIGPEAALAIEKREVMTIRNPVARADVLSAPLKAFFNVTRRCNLFCAHCYNDSGRSDSPELPLATVRAVLLELQRRGVFKVTVAGGEPLFHSEFDAIVDVWETTDLSVSVVTNGLCISRRRAERLGRSRNLRSVTVSLDGANAADNDAVRGAGVFDHALEGVQRLRAAYAGDLALRITLMRPNVVDAVRLVDVARSIGVRDIKVNAVNPYGRAKVRDDLWITSAEYTEARERLFQAAAACGMTVEVPAHKYQRDDNDQVGLCRAGEETFEIDADGAVYPCSFSFGRFLAGNVQSSSFDDVFRNLQLHSINNPWCYRCKGRGGRAEKVFGTPPPLIQILRGRE